MDQEQYFASIYEYISLLPPEQKADEETYQRRLQLCKTCDELADGMCRKCGCFVEARAARVNSDCPGEEKKW
ncbi:MAG TPA: hypothetical protein H9671_08725 [Firmicutes bacterium]|nr:hypothetical protein [Bacillota bacterium]